MKFGLIGKTLKHSYSKSYILSKYASVFPGLEYETVEIPDDGRLEYFIHNTDLDGFNVTIPYKEKIIPFLSGLTDEAKSVGAVNCVRRTEAGWLGHNTDVYGFMKSIKPFYQPEWKKALILGTGGAAKAVHVALRTLDIWTAYVSRNKNKQIPDGLILTYDELTPNVLEGIQLLVNATPVGMYPNMGEMPPLPLEHIGKNHFVADLIYNPEETLLLKKCKEKGAQVLNGLSMLYFQADASVKFWTEEKK
ncbi:MAG: shikimate dehydrogenase [Bacteroidia bacterium]|nr:shikimate dehydrogenase [Bacteroidia bacterium]